MKKPHLKMIPIKDKLKQLEIINPILNNAEFTFTP